MEFKEELISDTIDDAVGADEEDEERCGVWENEREGEGGLWLDCVMLFSFLHSDAIVQQVFDELGLQYDDEVCVCVCVCQ